MRILITNDDGINASALIPLAKWARKLGEVTVVAPKYEQSAKSHSIEIRRAFEVKKLCEEQGFEVYSVDSTPADCVRFSFLGMKKEFDLVISGINKGYNLGRDINYSGTAAATFEAASLGTNALALSTDVDSIEYALTKLDDVWKYVSENKLFDKNNIYNINIPPNGKEILVSKQGGRFYCDVYVSQENDMHLPTGHCIYKDSGKNEFDTDVVMHGYISITPLTLVRTNIAVYDELLHLNKGKV